MSIAARLEEIDNWAKILWDYMHMHQELKPADLLLILGNHDLKTAERGIEVWQQKLALRIIITGGFGKITRDWPRPEAEIFADKLFKAGVPKDIILLETASTNTGENFQFTKSLVAA